MSVIFWLCLLGVSSGDSPKTFSRELRPKPPKQVVPEQLGMPNVVIPDRKKPVPE